MDGLDGGRFGLRRRLDVLRGRGQDIGSLGLLDRPILSLEIGQHADTAHQQAEEEPGAQDPVAPKRSAARSRRSRGRQEFRPALGRRHRFFGVRPRLLDTLRIGVLRRGPCRALGLGPRLAVSHVRARIGPRREERGDRVRGHISGSGPRVQQIVERRAWGADGSRVLNQIRGDPLTLRHLRELQAHPADAVDVARDAARQVGDEPHRLGLEQRRVRAAGHLEPVRNVFADLRSGEGLQPAGVHRGVPGCGDLRSREALGQLQMPGEHDPRQRLAILFLHRDADQIIERLVHHGLGFVDEKNRLLAAAHAIGEHLAQGLRPTKPGYLVGRNARELAAYPQKILERQRAVTWKQDERAGRRELCLQLLQYCRLSGSRTAG